MTRPPSCLSELGFASLLQYSPNGVSTVSLASQECVRWIKRGSPVYIERIGMRSAEVSARGDLGGIFGLDTILVPVPRSKPQKADAVWPARRVAEELLRRGLGREVLTLLDRRVPIEKSALLRLGARRPGPEDHIRTITVVDALQVGSRNVVLVDDVVTRGATLLGCATLIRRVLPLVEIHAFAAVRTMSGQEIDGILAPMTGMISYSNGRLHREP